MACRLYVLTVLIETTIDLAIEGELFLRIKQADSASETSQTMPTYLTVFALAQYVFLDSYFDRSDVPVSFSVFQFVMAVHAVYTRNTLQFICLT